MGIGGHGIGLSGCTCYRLDYNAQVVGRDTDGKAESFAFALRGLLVSLVLILEEFGYFCSWPEMVRRRDLHLGTKLDH